MLFPCIVEIFSRELGRVIGARLLVAIIADNWEIRRLLIDFITNSYFSLKDSIRHVDLRVDGGALIVV